MGYGCSVHRQSGRMSLAGLWPEPLSPATRILGERVRTHREALGRSQEALAHQTGVHWTFLGQVERGRRNLSLHNLLKVAAGPGGRSGRAGPGTLAT